jgi:hypothetical protein
MAEQLASKFPPSLQENRRIGRLERSRRGPRMVKPLALAIQVPCTPLIELDMGEPLPCMRTQASSHSGKFNVLPGETLRKPLDKLMPRPFEVGAPRDSQEYRQTD